MATSINDPLAPPFQASDGSIAITDSRYSLTLKAGDFSVAQERELASDDCPYYKTPQFDDDGTAVYVAERRQALKIVKDGKVQSTIPTPEYVSTPVALSGNAIAYGMSDGSVNVIDRSGKVLQAHGVPTVFNLQVDPDDRPVEVRFGTHDRLYVQTNDDRLFCFGPEGKRWDATTRAKGMRWELNAPFESRDGSTLYTAGNTDLLALDSETGRKKWEARLDGSLNAQPVQDSQGNLYLYTGKDRVTILSPDGKVRHSFSTATKCSYDRRSSTRLALDGNGNIVLQPGKNEFHLYTPEGLPLMKLTCKDIFGTPDGFIFDYGLSRD